MRTFVEYGGIVFSGRSPDGAGFGIARAGLTGFHSSAAASSEDVQRPGGDGGFMLPSSLGSITRGVSGVAVAPSEGELIHLEQRFKWLRAQGAWRTLTWARGNVVLSALAQVSGEMQWTHDPWQGNFARFLISLRSVDPLWSGESRSVTIPAGSSAQVVNRGTEPSFPTAVVTGPISSGWSLFGFTVNRTVASGEKVTVNAASASFVSTSAGELMEVVSGFPAAVPVGVSSVTFSGSGSGNAVVTVADKFL